jgi:hypothetical protein
MRIVAGEFRGRTLATPKGSAIRPTSDRLREALFNVLAHGYDDPVAGARVIDLFAGTGALGLEALSRGAQAAVFVDDGAEARGLIRANIDALGLTRLSRSTLRARPRGVVAGVAGKGRLARRGGARRRRGEQRRPAPAPRWLRRRGSTRLWRYLAHLPPVCLNGWYGFLPPSASRAMRPYCRQAPPSNPCRSDPEWTFP